MFTRAAFTSHPVARREPLPPRQRLVGRFELSRPRPAPHELPRASPCRRKRCVSPTSATDSRHEHPACRPTPDHAPARHEALRPRCVRIHVDPPAITERGLRLSSDRKRISGGASLDGDPPASASPHSPVERSGAETPSVRLFEHSLALVALDRAPPNRASRRRLSRPRAEHAARPLTPSVATTPFGPCISAARVGHRQAPPPPPPRQKRLLCRNQDAFPRRVRSPPLLHPSSAFASAG